MKKGFVGAAQSRGLTKPPLGRSYFVFAKGLCVVRAWFDWGNGAAMLLLGTSVTHHLSVLPGYCNVEALLRQTDLTLILLSLFSIALPFPFTFFALLRNIIPKQIP